MSDADGDSGQTAPPALQPIRESERYATLDIVRGFAFLGVLLVNLVSDFRVSLSTHIQHFHTDADSINRTADCLVAGLLEFKAFTLFSLLFGVSLAILCERASERPVPVLRFLARRLLTLLGIGLCHLLLIWNGDILALYAVCGFLLLPFLRLPTRWLATLGLVALAVSYNLNWGFLWPSDRTFDALADEATRLYPTGGFFAILGFHFRETRQLIIPLLVLSLPRTWALMALGVVLWRTRLFKEPEKHRRLLWGVAWGCGLVGGFVSALQVWSNSTGQNPAPLIPGLLRDAGSYVPLAFAYAAGLVLVLQSPKAVRVCRPIGAVGQMALTNYLCHSIVLGILFYGYGLGLSGRLGTVAALGVGLALYVVQAAASAWWLRRFQFGPVEWLWRSLTYGRRPPLRRTKDEESK